ncbi:MAG: ATP-binding protein, partial [Desulfohalobiaceae bacterium]|nr:ATP-binding protein [Desulfohalobiaceae bacterium]
MAMTPSDSYQFQAETQKLLNIIIHSIYTNKEIFLRELISNASDALDKTRFEMSRGTEVADPEQELEIRIEPDKDNKILKIADTGIGMSKDELISNLGTIAKSGTEE